MSTIATESPAPDTLLIHVSGSVAAVTLNRPGTLNAINHNQRVKLIAAFERLNADPEIRAIVLAGAGRSFCAGQDQKESARMTTAEAAQRIDSYSRLYNVIRRLDKPLLARMQGHAAGAGLQLALLSDLRIAGRSAKIGMTELNVGSVAIIGSALLRAVAGEAAMKRLVLMAEFISAEQALALQLVHEVVPDEELDARVAIVAAALTAKPSTAMRLTKDWWRLMSEEAFNKAVEQARRSHAANYAEGDLRGGAKTFVASRV